MAGKKDRERFTIKFNENDPAHRKVIEILESQGAHSKAPFIVNAILHYIHCPETLDIPISWLMDKGAIEEFVRGILKEQTSETSTTHEGSMTQPAVEITPEGTIPSAADVRPMTEIPFVAEVEQKSEEMPATIFPADKSDPADKKTAQSTACALIMNTLSAFRNN